MAETLGKTVATIAAWGMLGLIGMMAVIDNSSYSGMWVALGAMVTALAATFFIWVLSEAVRKPAVNQPGQQRTASENDIAKAKRQPGDRLSMLLELMDEDEREAFKETLKQRLLDDMSLNDDGELGYRTTLEDLLDDDSLRRQRR